MQKTLFILAIFAASVLAGIFGLMSSSAPRESFMQKPVGAPLGAPGIGPYDGVNLPGIAAGWASNELPTGTAPVDSAPTQMHLAGNKMSPSCCGSTPLSGDSGCVCLTEGDKTMFATRGGNRAL